MTRAFLAVLLLDLCFSASAWGDGRPKQKVLIIGIDGCRTDALLAAKAPNLHALIRAGAFSDKTHIISPRPGAVADTISGPGWSSILTGVWADKHGVRDNHFKKLNFKEYPHFFARLKETQPKAYTASYVCWAPIHQYIVSAADESQPTLKDKEPYRVGDERATGMVIDLLRHGKADAIFVHLDNVDETGHAKGFSPAVPAYLQAIAEIDERIGRILEAMRGRKTYAQEDWLVIVCTDHGGKGTGHGGGRDVPEIREVFLIISGPGAAPGKIAGPTYLVDVAATALTHLGIHLDPTWQLDGRPVALRVREGRPGRKNAQTTMAYAKPA